VQSRKVAPSSTELTKISQSRQQEIAGKTFFDLSYHLPFARLPDPETDFYRNARIIQFKPRLVFYVFEALRPTDGIGSFSFSLKGGK
jgi:hypothetical protein